jgi:hypothetical protein
LIEKNSLSFEDELKRDDSIFIDKMAEADHNQLTDPTTIYMPDD